MEENEQAVLFQKEGKGKVYVSGRSGSGKTTLLLMRLHFLKEEGISFQHVLNLAAYKEGCELAETLSVLEITAKGDYEDFCGEPLGICGPYYYSETFDDELNFARDAYKLLSI